MSQTWQKERRHANLHFSKLYHGQSLQCHWTHGDSEYTPLHSDDKTCSLTVWMSQTWQKERRHSNLHFSISSTWPMPFSPKDTWKQRASPLHSDDRLVLRLSDTPDRRKEGTQTCTFLSSTTGNFSSPSFFIFLCFFTLILWETWYNKVIFVVPRTSL